MRSVWLLVFAFGCGGSVQNGDAGSDASVDVIAVGPGIACGTSTCKAGSEACCVQKMSQSCLSTVTGDCSGPVFRIQCDDATDCTSGTCCFTNVLQSAEVATGCAPTCTGMGTAQICARGADCPDGVPCKKYTCGGSFGGGTITLSLCAATAPSFCQ